MGIQQLMLGAGGVAKPTYLDDVFNNYLWTGTGNSQTITNGIDLTKGGLVWTKVRNINDNHALMDSTSKTGTYYDEHSSSGTYALQTSRNWGISSLNNNGFTLGGSNNQFNYSGGTHASWSFRKAKGFFDVVTWTGDNGGERNISHSLGSNIGMIIAKRTDTAATWHVWHRDLPNLYSLLELNNTQAVNNGSDAWGYPSQGGGPVINSSSFSVDNRLNDNNATYVAYVFAGGESTAATARSVDFDGSDMIFAPDDDAWDIGSVNCTLECWVNFRSHNSHDGIFHNVGNSGWNGGGWIMEPVGGVFHFYYHNGTSILNVQGAAIPLKQWQHIAVTKSGSTIKIYQDGLLTGSGTISGTIRNGTNSLKIGGQCVGADCDALISNVRITIGQVLYTSSFKPSTVPLTTTSQGATASNVKLLCCNNSSTTGATVTPGNINTYGDPTASIDSPFDDPAGFVFGEEKDQNVIKTGSYKGSGSTGLEVNLGFEPQWLLIKEIDASNRPWVLFDSMRGIVDGREDMELNANSNGDESTGNNRIKLTSTGFQFETSHGDYNGSSNYVYMAIRRPDGYVGKPKTATEVFAVVAGTSNNDIPAFVSGHPTDFTLFKDFAGNGSWYSQARLTGTGYMIPSDTNAEASSGNNTWDFPNGYYKATGNWSASMNWMWRRHAGFDCITHTGNGVAGRQIKHSLNAVPEMIWSKPRSNADHWKVYHKGLNNGTTPEQWFINLNDNGTEAQGSNSGAQIWNNEAPTSTHFTVGTDNGTNGSGWTYLALLFSSVEGISKCGYYTGSSSDVTITTGFQPRFVIIKRTDGGTYPWMVLDTLRGWDSSNNSGDDPYLRLNQNDAQVNFDNGYTTSTGFVVDAGSAFVNTTGSPSNYIYYAHA